MPSATVRQKGVGRAHEGSDRDGDNDVERAHLRERSAPDDAHSDDRHDVDHNCGEHRAEKLLVAGPPPDAH